MVIGHSLVIMQYQGVNRFVLGFLLSVQEMTHLSMLKYRYTALYGLWTYTPDNQRPGTFNEIPSKWKKPQADRLTKHIAI